MTKYKYYFRQPRSAIVKDMLLLVAAGGVLAIAATSPYFAVNLINAYKRDKRLPKKKVLSAFYHLKKAGLLDVESSNHQIYILLTDEGRRKAGWLQINDLKITKPKRWDGKWRIVIFDIAHEARAKREAFRGFLIRLGFYQLQKSVWVHPFDCSSEIDLLKDFFKFDSRELRRIEATSIGDAKAVKKFFNI